MIEKYTRQDVEGDLDLLRTMHEDRKKVFVDTLKWNLPNDGTLESDEFDEDPEAYLIGKDRFGLHRVSVRLLDTERPHILGSLFSFLCEGPVPTGPSIKEITRYIASPRAKASERLLARNMMARALIEYGQRHQISHYTAVCDLSFLSQILAAGWRCDPLGMPQKIDGSIIGAFCIHVEPDTIEKMSGSWRYTRPALQDHDLAVAA